MSLNLNSYNEAKESLKVLVCNECSKEFLLNGVEIQKLVIDDSKNNLHFVYRYFKCPHCNAYYTVCIDDTYSEVLERNYNTVLSRVQRRLSKGKEVEQSSFDVLEKRRKALLKRRKILMDKYSKVFTEIAKTKLG